MRYVQGKGIDVNDGVFAGLRKGKGVERYRFQVLETSGPLDGVMFGHQGDDLGRTTRVQRKKRRRHIPFRFCLKSLVLSPLVLLFLHSVMATASVAFKSREDHRKQIELGKRVKLEVQRFITRISTGKEHVKRNDKIADGVMSSQHSYIHPCPTLLWGHDT
ncbi:hypothetical protein Pyn_16246 [Prunus yedoensis var. nudiflora]|uniref:Uncharacterized protein n=1 Tax=Prunus yedoensis var. nudiflora TaxID=2094558 RepID=A0A314YRS1_PRUYE|nr:hypothetical protein Pyn_16246 [Prunus yedoensis var. nudiflora]